MCIHGGPGNYHKWFIQKIYGYPRLHIKFIGKLRVSYQCSLMKTGPQLHKLSRICGYTDWNQTSDFESKGNYGD